MASMAFPQLECAQAWQGIFIFVATPSGSPLIAFLIAVFDCAFVSIIIDEYEKRNQTAIRTAIRPPFFFYVLRILA